MLSAKTKKITIILLISIISSYLFFSCQSEKEDITYNEKITLKQWLADRKHFDQILLYSGSRGGEINCDSIKAIVARFKLKEFKQKTYSSLTWCAKDDKDKLTEYLLKNVASGLHPQRIDSIEYASVYRGIKDEIYELHTKFWKDKDTTHFMEMEQRKNLELFYIRKSMSNPSQENFAKVDSIVLSNTQFLLNFCEKVGYPFYVEASHFNSFRLIDPTIMAMHAPDESKLKLIECAMDKAEKGETSWYNPIQIAIALFSSGISQKPVYPLWLTHFDKTDNLDIENSYLQLYSIRRFYNYSNIIKIQPSKYNNSDSEIINNQLHEIKKALIEEFSFAPEYLIISNEPDARELDYSDIAPYKYTLTVVGR